MPIVTVPVTTSTKKKTIYNSNQRVNAKTIGNIPGLEDDLVLYPKSITMIIRELFDVLPTDKQFFNGTVESFNTTEIVTKEGAYLVGDDIYFLEALTLVPTAAGFWGFFEIELEAIDSDPASLQFFDVSTNTVSQQVVNTRKSYNIKVYENYNTTASFPTLTPGRIKWIEFKKDAAFGNIIEVSKLLNSVVLPKDKSGTVALLEDQTFIGLNDTPGSYASQKRRIAQVNNAENGLTFKSIFDVGDYKHSNRIYTPSVSVPWIRADVDWANLALENYIDLAPYLTGFNYSSDEGTTTNYTATVEVATNPRLTLTNNTIHTDLIRHLLDDLRFFAWNESINDIDTIDATRVSNWGMVIEIVASTAPGISAGSKQVITWSSSLALTLDPASRIIRISGTTSGTGSITFRVKPFARQADSNARWRKIDDAVLQSGFAGLRRLDQGQDHQHAYASGGQDLAIPGKTNGMHDTTSSGGPNVSASIDAALTSESYKGSVAGAYSTNIRSANGISRGGNKGRPRAGGSYLYMYTGEVV